MSDQITLPALPRQEGVEFRNVPGFPGYCVGSDGAVWSFLRRGPRGGPGIGGCRFLDAGRPMRRHYGRYVEVSLRLPGDQKFRLAVHRLVLEAFVGPCPDGMEACHIDGDSWNNSLSNLRWDTPLANARDRKRHGSHCCGERAPNHKLTATDVREIRRLTADGRTALLAVARRFGVSKDHVERIRDRTVWRHLEEEMPDQIGRGAGVKIAIREDPSAGIVRAYLSSMDDRDYTEVATVSVALLRACPDAFDAWKAMLTAALGHMLRETGHTPLGFFEVRPEEKN
jgi:hypothetical protein